MYRYQKDWFCTLMSSSMFFQRRSCWFRIKKLMPRTTSQHHGILKIPVFPRVPHEWLYLIVPGEASKRKRSKSEDMDNVHSKHRRYMGEDYEAELQVKITARKDVDLKLQKVEQRYRAKNIYTHLSLVSPSLNQQSFHTHSVSPNTFSVLWLNIGCNSNGKGA